MGSVLSFLVGFIITIAVIYIAFLLAPYINNVKVRLTKRLGGPTVEFLEEQAVNIVKNIEKQFIEKYGDEIYEEDPNGNIRHGIARQFIKDILVKTGLEDKVFDVDIDELIKGSVKAAELIKNKNPYKK